ncbi:MAG TPA: fumarate hydrolyase [Anaerolineae bacterium]|nr:fumarate hydrolyase [Anaerolineae bacterium]
MRNIQIPISDETIRSLKMGEAVQLSGIMMTGRDNVHKWLNDTFIKKTRTPQGDDLDVYEAIKPILNNGIIYHCGPVVAGVETKEYRFVAAGPTTSIREEPYEGDIMRYFNLKGVIGKGGMGAKTLLACQEVPAVYFHAIGGAASLIAQSVKRVLNVYKLDFGVPEAMWVIEVENFPVVVTMDAHGNSLHEKVESNSRTVLEDIIHVA